MIKVISGDITRLDVDAIVNAANEQLLPGSGVCGAIHKAAGKGLLKECLALKGCPVGSAVITHGYNLKAKFVVHAVGPRYHENPIDSPKLLRSAYIESLDLAVLKGIKSIAFPCISTGVFGYPKGDAANIAISAIRDFLKHSDLKVICCCFDDEDLTIYNNLLD
jgi:O-acetyl-ADP-ribose deacetylase (regulator of RNase III)